ncbi:hypothetical protein EZV62_021897 [Acer yangbiense]|uniref:DUF4283 domain-containing protein n=1 Tax=Acer yangbiense TaxID=1000413 RepID=A0A5C7H6Q7_9ROSI|nr:hypothetical protein EZV62_021897 [Acer yangbiense]
MTQKLWSLILPLKIKNFIWKAYYNWIPTMPNLFRWKVAAQDYCPFCLKKGESTLHALWGCGKLKVARKDWLPYRIPTPVAFMRILRRILVMWWGGLLVFLPSSKLVGWWVCVALLPVVVVKWVVDGTHLDSADGAILVDIAGLREACGGLIVAFSLRHTNMVAHVLAKQALKNSDDFFWLEEFPRCVALVIQADMPDYCLLLNKFWLKKGRFGMMVVEEKEISGFGFVSWLDDDEFLVEQLWRILTSKRVNRDAFMLVIGRIWQVRHGITIESITGNIFSFHFKDTYDLERVISGEPWSFDNALLALKRPEGKGTIDSLIFDTADFWIQIHKVPILCMTYEIGKFLGGLIGEVLEVDGSSSGDCVGKFLRVRVRVNIAKSLTRCLRVDILGDGVLTLMILRYERLPNHCFICGVVSHFTSECAETEPLPVVDGKVQFPFGIWLKASGPIKNFNYQGHRDMSFLPVNGGGYRRFNSGSREVKQNSETGSGDISVSHDASTSISKSRGFPMQVQMHDGLLGAVGSIATHMEVGSLPAVSGTDQPAVEVVTLMVNGTESRGLNEGKMVEDTCSTSELRKGIPNSGSDPLDPVVSVQEIGSDFQA